MQLGRLPVLGVFELEPVDIVRLNGAVVDPVDDTITLPPLCETRTRSRPTATPPKNIVSSASLSGIAGVWAAAAIVSAPTVRAMPAAVQ